MMSASVGALLPSTATLVEGAPAETPSYSEWPRQVFRRYSVDMHVPDWSPDLLGRFDAKEFVRLIASAEPSR